MPFNVTANILLPAFSDKVGAILIELKNALVASGKWRVRGSGDGKGAFRLIGQTAGPSYDVFTTAPGYRTDVTSWWPSWPNGLAGTISSPGAWMVLEEIASARCLTIQRCTGQNQYDPITISAAISTGVAAVGATHTAPPAMTGTSAFLIGNTFNTSGYFGAETADNGGNELNLGANIEHWMHVAVQDEVFAGSVSPFWASVWERTRNKQVFGAIWEVLSDVDALHAAQPLVAAMGAWSRVFGTNGGTFGESGFRGSTSAFRGGAGFQAIAFERVARYLGSDGPSGNIPTAQIVPPAVQQVQSDGRVRTERPWCYQPALGTRTVGRLTHYYMNKVARDYPTTYGVATTTPRIALGQLIAPWKAGTAPNSSP